MTLRLKGIPMNGPPPTVSSDPDGGIVGTNDHAVGSVAGHLSRGPAGPQGPKGDPGLHGTPGRDGAFNVKEGTFGAVGDGVADDTDAIQAAIDASSDGFTSLGPVLIPAGTYKVTRSLTLKSKVVIKGEGEASYIDFRTPTFAGDALFEFAGSTIFDVSISNMKMVGNSYDLDNTSACTAVYLNGSSSVTGFAAFGLVVQNFQTGIYVRSDSGYVGDPIVWNNKIRGCSYSAIRYSGTIDGGIANNIIDCTRQGIGDELDGIVGIWASSPTPNGSTSYNQNLSVTQNHVLEARYEGINVMARHVNITGNNVRDCVQTGMLIEPMVREDPTEEEVESYGAISGNTVTGSNDNIVLRRDPVNNFRGVRNIAVTGNVTAGGNYGIRVGAGGAYISGPVDYALSGNVCKGHANSGILIHDGQRCTVGANVAEGGQSGLAIIGTSYLITVTGGVYSSTGVEGDGISIGGTSSHVTLTGAAVYNVNRSGVRISDDADYVFITALMAVDDRETPSMDQAVVVTGSGTHVYVDGNSVSQGHTHPEGPWQGVNSVNGIGTESGPGDEPTAANWKIGDIVQYVDSTDGSGDGVYVLGLDGVTWGQMADHSLIQLTVEDVGINWWPAGYLSGHYYVCNSPASTYSSDTIGNETLRVTPWIVSSTITIDRMWVEHISPGNAGSVFRFGLYGNNGGVPGNLLIDGGTVPVDGAGAVQEVTVNQILPPGLYWVGGAIQGADTTQPFMRTVTAPGGGFNTAISFGTSLPTANTTRLGFNRADISGALPSPMGVSYASGGAAPRIGFRVA